MSLSSFSGAVIHQRYCFFRPRGVRMEAGLKTREAVIMARSGERPNIFIIMSDQHSKRFVGSYGNSIVRTPALDNLSSEGMRFSSAYCPSPLCVPSRMSFMTSCSPSANEVWNNRHILNSSVPTWATLLAAGGYETTLLGRMHFNGPDQRHGFTNRPFGEGHAGMFGAPPRGGPVWTRYPGSTTGQHRETVEIAGRGRTHYQWADIECTRAAVDWIREKGSSRSSRPFAAVLGYLLPHCPFIAPRHLFDYYYPRTDIPETEENQPASVKRHRRLRGFDEPPLPEERVRVARAAYYGLCEMTDSMIGEVITALDETGLSKNTVVIYVSDHGEMAGSHGCWTKSIYYEESAGIPFIARWPGVIPAGVESPAVCSLVDIGPTLAEFAGCEFPYRVDGRPLNRILTRGSDPDWPDTAFSELVDEKSGGPVPGRMVRQGEWKLWVHADSENLPPVMFNLSEDPGELNDLGQDPAFAPVREELIERVRAGWNPGESAAKTARFGEYHRLQSKWGKAVNPPCPDKLAWPGPEYEKDVELL